MAKMDQQKEHNDQKFHKMKASISKLDVQVGQIAATLSQREQGRFPNQLEVSPSHEQVKANTTLRSDQVVQRNAPMMEEIRDDDGIHEEDAEARNDE